MSLKDFLIFDQEKSNDVNVYPDPLEVTLELLTPRVYVDKNESYVYVYCDPRKPGKYSYDGGDCSFLFEPFYVGKGHGYRWIAHLNDVYKNKGRKTYKSNKIRKIKEVVGKDPIIIKYKENLSDKDAQVLEIKLIKAIGRIDLKTGSLTNLTDGGDGGKGRIVTVNEREMISKRHKGKKVSVETRLKLSLINKGKKISEETKRKISNSEKGEKNSNYGNKWNILQRIRMSIQRKGSKLSDEHKRKISNITRGVPNSFYGKHHSIEQREKWSEMRKGTRLGKKKSFYGKIHNEESRKKMGKSSKLRTKYIYYFKDLSSNKEYFNIKNLQDFMINHDIGNQGNLKFIDNELVYKNKWVIKRKLKDK